jgi:cytochrome oxidase Cu insertion factor (SCO1/SenC/PrrC family)
VKRWLLILALVATSTLGVTAYRMLYQYPKPQIPSNVGKPAPDFTLPDQDGKPFTLSSLRGAPVVLIFYRGYW